MISGRYGIKHIQSNFDLNLIRSTQPKNVDLKATSKYNELIFTLNTSSALSLSYKEQNADEQRFNCYTFSSLTLGYCNEARLSISNSKEKYKTLNNNTLMLINGSNEEFKIRYYQALNSTLIDEFILYLASSKNSFDWLSPIEELQTGFLSNLSFNGSTIGSIVRQEIKRLPQREDFILNKVGINVINNISLNRYLDYFYIIDFVLVEPEDYRIYRSIPKNNIKIETGITLLASDSISLSLFGTLYKNNLFGYEDISFNQRSEHHFNKVFGSLNIKLKFLF